MKITNLKIVFSGLYKKFDRLSTAWVSVGHSVPFGDLYVCMVILSLYNSL